MLNFSSFLTTKKESKLTNTILRGLALFYLVYLLVVFFEVLKGGSYLVFSPDHIFFIIFSFIIIFELGGALLISFSRYFVLFLSFASMRGIVDNLNYNVNYMTPIAFDQLLFGGEISTKVFQDHFLQFSPGLDTLALFVYTWHFYLPFFFGMLLWWKSKKLYDPYFLALTITIYLSLLTFFAVPVAPPWLASDQGLVDIHHLTLETGPTLGWNSLPSIYRLFNANEVAAFPSLHFAFPILISIFAFQAFGKKAFPVLIYPALMAFSLIYLGEHYVLDLLGGFIYAVMGVALSYYVIVSYSKSSIPVLLDQL